MSIPRSTPEIHEGDFGVILRFTAVRSKLLPLDLSTVTSIYVAFMRPDGSVFTREVTLAPSEDSSLPDGSDGKAYYIIEDGDLDMPGNWFFQLFINFNGTKFLGSTVGCLTIYPSLISVSELLSP